MVDLIKTATIIMAIMIIIRAARSLVAEAAIVVFPNLAVVTIVGRTSYQQHPSRRRQALQVFLHSYPFLHVLLAITPPPL